ncbi:phenylalanine--tRNA ligase subunit beta [Candidatus Falkowbacteria bacterium]|nr:phenylalanine--tRNA ligase subunit beta [Candidatus Falkowbacteria bacterium]
MLVSLNWLKKFVDVPKGFSSQDLALKLTSATVEVEGITEQGELLRDVVVGKIVAITEHPNADKLKLVSVDAGRDQYTVVCGGTNLRDSMLVAMAKVGARVHWHGEAALTELKPVKIRGQESHGMICTSEELSLRHLFAQSSETEILDLTELKLPVGTSLAEALELDDTVIEIDNKSMTHRPDLWGVYGLARELAAVLNVPLLDYAVPELKGGRGKKLKVEIKDKAKCRRYIGVVIDGVRVEPSPRALRQVLENSGVRSINNIVDVTNFVMLELGNPLHAFDWRQIELGAIVVDTAKKGEKFTTLDGVERALNEEMLLIKDGKKSVALAGVMGGENSEIQADTTTILLESANFEATNIRKTSMKLGLRTEGSARWEKGISPLQAELAARKAVAMILELCPGAKVASKVVDENFYKFIAPEIELNLDWLDHRVGVPLEKKGVVDILERLGFAVKDKKDTLLVSVPYWRATGDVSLPEDIVEEVARMYGYDRIKPSMPMVELCAPSVNLERQLERRVKNILVGYGLTEASNYSLVDPVFLETLLGPTFKPELIIRLKNYLSVEQSVLRPALSPGLLRNVADNSRFYAAVRLFEIGRAFINRSDPAGYSRRSGSDDRLPWQHRLLGGVVLDPADDQPFSTVKGLVSSLLDALGYDYYFDTLDNVPGFMEAARTVKVVVAGSAIGQLGEVNASTASMLGIHQAAALFELDFTLLAALPRQESVYAGVSKYPSVFRDVAIVLDQQYPWEDIKKEVKKAGGTLLTSVDLFDVYEGGKIEAGQRSLAFHLKYWSSERTLESAEVDALQQKVTAALQKKFAAEVR